MATTIPNKLYVTIQYRDDASTESGLLGFASPYTKDAAFEKRKATQDSWAYGHGATVTIDENDDITVSGEGHRGGYGASATKWDATMLFMANCYPKIIPNDPVEGFQIAKSVRRYGGWGGSGNVVWRLADPRGFELEIGSENFARIVDCSTIVNGVIQGKCAWGRDSGKNILLPELSEPYQEAVSLTAKSNTKIPLKDVQVGDTVELLSTKVESDDLVCQYFGKYYFLSTSSYANSRGYNTTGEVTFNTDQTERYLFKSLKTGNYFVLSTVKIVSIVNKLSAPLVKLEVAQEATNWLSVSNRIGEDPTIFLISPSKINLSTVTMALEPITDVITDQWPTGGNYWSRTDAIIAQTKDQTFWLATTGGETRKPEPQLTKISLFLAECKLQIVKVISRTGIGYWARDDYANVTQPVDDFNALTKFRIVISANGVTSKIYRIGYY